MQERGVGTGSAEKKDSRGIIKIVGTVCLCLLTKREETHELRSRISVVEASPAIRTEIDTEIQHLSEFISAFLNSRSV